MEETRSPDIGVALSDLEPVLKAVAMRLCRNRADADDLLQETYVRGLRGAHRFAAGTNLRAWAVSIMRNAFIDRCRKQRIERTTTNKLSVAPRDPAPPVDGGEPAWAQLTMDDLRRAATRLGAGFREVFELHTFGGLSYRDISARLEIPERTVGTRLTRARHKLRELLLGELSAVAEAAQ